MGGAMSSRYTELNSQLHALKLPTMAESFSEIALKAARNGVSHEAYLHELVRLEWEARAQRRRARLLSESGLPREKTFRTLQLGAFPPLIRQQIERLRSGAFVQQAVNVVVVGKPGAGKSHLLASLGHALVEQGYPVLWRSTAHLMQRLLAAKRDLRLPQELAKLDRYACLILDDIGYVQHDQDEMEILFTLLSERYERKTVMISTNLVFSEWTRIFKSPMTTMAAIDRIVHHCVIVDMMAIDSYRAKEATITNQQATSIRLDAVAATTMNGQEASPVTSENGVP
jgi:DNA replication protein DnaC